MLQDLQKLDQKGLRTPESKLPKIQSHFFHQLLHFKQRLMLRSRLGTLAILQTLCCRKLCQYPFNITLRETQGLQGLVAYSMKPQGVACKVGDVTTSASTLTAKFRLQVSADYPSYLCISHHTRWLLENQCKISSSNSHKRLTSQLTFSNLHRKATQNSVFSIWSHLQSSGPSPLQIQVAHFAGQKTQASPFHSASITAAGFVEQHVRAALLASTETGVIRKLTWEPQKGSQLQRDA